MPQEVSLLTAKEICEQALQLIGAMSLDDDEADPREMRRALRWLDLSMLHASGVGRLLFLVPTTETIPLVVGQPDYELKNYSSSPQKIQYPIKASLYDSSNQLQHELEIVTRRQAEDYNPTDTGDPRKIYIDRLEPNLNLRIYPIIQATGSYIKLVVQRYPRSVVETKTGNVNHGWPMSWQQWMIFEVAGKLGQGLVRKLPDAEISRLATQAAFFKEQLETFSNKEHASQPRQTKPYDPLESDSNSLPPNDYHWRR